MPCISIWHGKIINSGFCASTDSSPSIASSRHCSRARVTDCITAFSKAGSLRGSLLSSSTLLSIIRLAFLDASLHLRSSPETNVVYALRSHTYHGSST